MNTAFAMFLVVPIAKRRDGDETIADIDWRMVKKCCETMLSPNLKTSFLDVLTRCWKYNGFVICVWYMARIDPITACAIYDVMRTPY